MKFSIKDFFGKCDQIRSFLRIWLHLMKKSLMENFIFCAVKKVQQNKNWLYQSTSFVKGSWFESFKVIVLLEEIKKK